MNTEIGVLFRGMQQSSQVSNHRYTMRVLLS